MEHGASVKVTTCPKMYKCPAQEPPKYVHANMCIAMYLMNYQLWNWARVEQNYKNTYVHIYSVGILHTKAPTYNKLW